MCNNSNSITSNSTNSYNADGSDSSNKQHINSNSIALKSVREYSNTYESI